MSRLLKTYRLSLPIFAFVLMLSAVGFSLFNAQPASAYTINNDFMVFKKTKSGHDYFLYYDGHADTFKIINWTPQINITKGSCDSGDDGGKTNFMTGKDFIDCNTLTIQEDSGSDAWFADANYTYKIGDFDHSEFANVGGGKILDWGSSTDGGSLANRGQYIKAKSGANGCDTPDNPDYSEGCSILIYFSYDYHNDYSDDQDDFKIALDSEFHGSGDTKHEYYYRGPQSKVYRTLTFHSNGGSSVTDSPSDGGNAIWPHTSGTSLLREYIKGTTATNFPTPTMTDCGFNGWSHEAAAGGTLHSSQDMDNDEDLYAQWTCFHLEPTVSDVPTTVEAGGSFTVKAEIANTGNGPSASASYELKRIINGASGAVGAALTTVPYSFLANSNTVVFNYPEISTDHPPGTVMCYVLSVTPHSATDSGTVSSAYSTSPPVVNCVTIVKRPKTQVWGGDLFVGGFTDTGVSIKAGKNFGSWVEYAIFATGNIKGTASGAAFAGPGMTTPTNACGYSTLSFSNSPPTGGCTAAADTIGKYSNVLNPPDVEARFQTNASTPVLASTASLNGLQGVYKANGNLTITGGNIAKGKWVVINASGHDVTISGDINYTTETLYKPSDIPQVVIIANNITINDSASSTSVKHLDAWLIAKNGNIYTCDTDPRTINDCKDQLVVNGPVIANKLFLRRTYGSGSGGTTGDPGEIFNLRADAYLWAYGLSSGEGKIQTVYTTELPPRL